jgi:L-fuculose-phosphate aldolase
VDIEPDDLVEPAPDGSRVTGRHVPSSEVQMHVCIYPEPADVQPEVHAHPPTTTGFGVAGLDFMDGVLPEIIFLLGGVSLVPHARPGTPALAEALVPYLSEHDAFLLANRGATTEGPTLRRALQGRESLEHAARTLYVARGLGRTTQLSAREAAALRRARDEAHMQAPAPAADAGDG